MIKWLLIKIKSLGYDLSEDVAIVEVHFKVNRIVDGVVIVCLELDIASVFELLPLVGSHSVTFYHLLLQRPFELLSFFTFGLVLLQHLNLQ